MLLEPRGLQMLTTVSGFFFKCGFWGLDSGHQCSYLISHLAGISPVVGRGWERVVSNRCVWSSEISVKWMGKAGPHRAWWHHKRCVYTTWSPCLCLLCLRGWEGKKRRDTLSLAWLVLFRGTSVFPSHYWILLETVSSFSNVRSAVLIRIGLNPPMKLNTGPMIYYLYKTSLIIIKKKDSSQI